MQKHSNEIEGLDIIVRCLENDIIIDDEGVDDDENEVTMFVIIVEITGNVIFLVICLDADVIDDEIDDI